MFQVGDVVRIAPSSEFYVPDTPNNPIDISGVVVSIRDGYGFGIGVKWSNGLINSYNPHDLILEVPLKTETTKSVEEEICEAKGVLKLIHTYIDPTAVVAGGAPRDWIKGVGSNDVDIFLGFPAHYTKSDIQGRLVSLLGSDQVYEMGAAYDHSAMSDLKCVFRWINEGKEYQFIVVNTDPRELINKFPYSHVCAMFDGEEFKTTLFFDYFVKYGISTALTATTEKYKAKADKYMEDNGVELSPDPFDTLKLVASKIREG